MTNLKLSPATLAAQALRHIDEATGAIVPPLHTGSTYARDEDYETRGPFFYSRFGSPTVNHAEEVLAALDGADKSLLFNSGMSAIVAVFEALPASAHIVVPRVMYHGVIHWLDRLVKKGYLTKSVYEQGDMGSLRDVVSQKKPDLVWIESPTNPNWDVTDIAESAKIAHAAGALLVCDSTSAPPVTTDTLGLGADIAFQSATKYLNGHSDLTAGVLSYKSDMPLAEDLEFVRSLQGNALQGFEAWMLLRGMRTLYPRFAQASQSALKIATHFEHHPRLSAVLYPGLPSHSHHAVAAKQMTAGFGGMMSILVKGGQQAARDVCRYCQVFVPATSLGGVESLIEHRIAVEGDKPFSDVTLLRLSIGMEDPDDLIADLEQALERASA